MRGEIVKIVGEVGGLALSGVIAVIGATDSAPMQVSAIVAVLGFAGVLVRQIMQNQKAIWSIVAHKDAEIADKDRQLDAKDHRIAFTEWEREKLRWTYGERATDPGPAPIREVTP